MVLDEASATLSPLPDILSKGLVAVSTFGLLSFFCSVSLLFYLTYRLITWHFSSTTPRKVPPNQFLLLIYNLLLADIQQAMAFLLNISALKNNAIVVGTTTCWAQGWFVSTGDLASSVFICAIAIHTFMAVVREYRFPPRVFYISIGFCWVFVYTLGAAGPIAHGQDFFVRASAWCWINNQYAHERLWLHYIWIFICMFLTIVLYALIFLHLNRKTRAQSNSSMALTTPLMILYPLIYTVCTAPLAAGRIYALAGHDVSLGYFCAAGTMIACNGWLDVLLYASTRADIVFSEEMPDENDGINTFGLFGVKGGDLGVKTVIEGGDGRGHHRGAGGGSSSRGLAARLGRGRGGESVENLYGLGGIGLGGIGVKENVDVSVETVGVKELGIKRTGSQQWDERSRKSSGAGRSDGSAGDLAVYK